MALLFTGFAACGGTNRASSSGTGAQSAAVQSTAEYDLAADYWLKRGQPRAGLEHALRAVELDDKNADAQHLLALLYLDFCRRDPGDCRLKDAEMRTRLALDAKPEFREAQNTLGLVLIHEKRYSDAVKVLLPLTQNLLYETPENAWGNLGWAYLENGQLSEAVGALSRSVTIQPAFCVGHYRLGQALARQQSYQRAVEAYTQALQVADGRCQGLQVAYAERAEAYQKLNRPEDARSDNLECVRLEKNSETGRQCATRLSN
jgi:Tfp pilus assembly protein PilF